MSLLDMSLWHGKAYPSGWTQLGGGEGAAVESAAGASLGILTRDVMAGSDLARKIPPGTSSGGPASIDAFTGTRWVTIRGDIAPYPF